MTGTQKITLAWIVCHPWRSCEECCQAVKYKSGVSWQEVNNAHLYLRRSLRIKKRGKGANTVWAVSEDV